MKSRRREDEEHRLDEGQRPKESGTVFNSETLSRVTEIFPHPIALQKRFDGESGSSDLRAHLPRAKVRSDPDSYTLQTYNDNDNDDRNDIFSQLHPVVSAAPSFKS